MSNYSQAAVYPTFPMAKQEGDTYHQPPTKGEDGDVIGYATQTIDKDATALHAFWSDLALIPLWQEHVVSVTPINDRVSHWVMGNPEEEDGKRIEFDSEVVESIPGKKISWKSITEGVHQHGTVTFEEGPRGTRVTLVQAFKVPGGSAGNALAAIAKRSPRQTVIEDLRHFKELTETGSIPSVKGQPHGPRGISGAIKEWMYGETNPTPPGTSETN